MRFLCFHYYKNVKAAAAAAAAAASVPAVTTGADIDTDELVDETGVDPKDIELVTLQVRPAREGLFLFPLLILFSPAPGIYAF